MPGKDDDLLARLNALKPSSVSFNPATNAPSVDVEVSKPLSTEDRLAERLKGLRGGSASFEGTSGASKDTADSLTARVQDEVEAEKDPIKDWQQGGEDEQNLEELLAELGPDDQWKLDPEDPKNINNLLKEAKDALPPEHETVRRDGNDDGQPHPRAPSNQNRTGDDDEDGREDQKDEEVADDYVKRVLAELEIEAKYGGGSDQNDEEDREQDHEPSQSALQLPSTPSNLPRPPTAAEPPSYEDSELETRFSKLGLDLPSTPSTIPSAKAKATNKPGLASVKKAQAKSNLPTFTDEDIDSWCCICNEDGEASSPSKHNAMLGKTIAHPKSTNFDEEGEEFQTPPAKRVKRDVSDYVEKSPKNASNNRPRKHIIPDSDADSEDEEYDEEPKNRQTDLESALPPIETDKEAIEAYEASRAAEQEELGLKERLEGREWTRGKSSIYVDAFNLALDTVLEDESHLFDEAEHDVFKQWRELSYEAQYLYVRLFLRKASSWHRVNRLRYHSDIADLQKAIDDLQHPTQLPAPSSQVERHAGEFEPPENADLGEVFTFADRSDESIKDLEAASSLLLLDELKAFAKDFKVQGKNKKELLRAFRRASGKQTGLGFSSLKRSDTEESIVSIGSATWDNNSRESTPSKLENRDAYFVNKILAETGPCIRLSLPALQLFERVHLVFYRSTEWTEKSLTTIILARIARWNFPQYIVSRSANIFASRSLLLEFEAAVRTQFKVDSILEFNGTPTKESLQGILDIFDDVYGRWKVLLAEEQRKEDSIYSTGEGAYLRRLSPAWVYTRIVHKGAYVLGKFKDHKREHEILCDLLRQRLFHTSRRGDWYQRKALLEEHYMHLHLPSPPSCKDDESKKKHWRRVALQTCETGLEDQLTHLIFHHDLQKRTIKLEKSLKIPKREQHDFGHVRLTKATERTFYGVKIERSPNAANRRNSEQSMKLGYRGTKTIWLDPAIETTIDLETGEEKKVEAECSVEEMCLSSYRALGCKGYHSEGRILRTLFAYLFFDVLFVYIPNVFQTEYQTCPLDLHTDAFYPSRISEVNARLNEISNGDAPKLIRTVWDEHHELKTCVVGLDWTYAIKDLVEIAHAFPPAALSSAMKTMAQEYGQRGGGVPDLFLWKTGDADETKEGAGAGEVMFAEVKSENDRLSDTQRMWIDVLSGAGVKVELCHALASEVRVKS
ncbi:hypothetical protein LTR37_007650 [Vermiconidia calcicola]|uniref:Uncharacterized protein n=1 Tax=Vermiconidia calcicola TaxID=1690605 RepID=A0ACC3NCS8_9PEZI|nr:hypothetical protein LTR37_007650 [Vermiconidia calcicola]